MSSVSSVSFQLLDSLSRDKEQLSSDKTQADGIFIKNNLFVL